MKPLLTIISLVLLISSNAFSQVGSDCSNPNVISLPFSLTNASTAGFGDNFNEPDVCANSSYITGDDYVMTYTPAVDECVTFDFNSASTSYESLFLMDGCPGAGGTCMVMQRGGLITVEPLHASSNSNPNGLTDVNLTGGVTYYIVVSKDEFGGQSMTFDLNITGGVCPTCFDGIRNGDEENIDCGGSCAAICAGTACATAFDITSIPYRSENNTTENMGNNYTSYACAGGSGWNGEDFVYKYTATANDTCVSIALEDLRNIDIEVFLYDGCPGVSTCITSSSHSTGAPHPAAYIYDQSLTAGTEYYIVIDGASGDNDFDFSIGNYCSAPPCGATNPIASDFCSSATVLDNLDGFCGTTSSTYTTSPADDPDGTEFCASIENNSWYKFTADSTAAAINVYVYDCIGASIEGIQIVIYETSDCNTYNPVSNCWNPQIMTNGTILASNLTVGQDYYIMVDGNGGEVCNYTIHAEAGIVVSPSNCSANAGNVTSSISNGDGSSPAANEHVLCRNATLDITSSGYTLPSNDPLFANADMGYLIYSCDPGLTPDPFTDACAFTTAGEPDVIDYGSSISLINDGSTVANFPGATNQTYWIVPITLKAGSPDLRIDDTCYALGTPIKVTFLDSIIAKVDTAECNNGLVTLSVSGGYLKFFSGEYTIVNTGSGTLNTTKVSVENGQFTISGLNDGDSYSVNITDNSGCPVSISGTFVSCDCSTQGLVASFTTTPTEGDVPFETTIVNTSENATTYEWHFGNGDTSNLETPTYTYIELGEFDLLLIAKNENGCIDSSSLVRIVVTNDCELSIPSAFTPDDNGQNDTWNITCLDNENNATVIVYNRWGTAVYESEGGINYTPWTGKNDNGETLPMGSYYYVLTIQGEEPINGTITLIK